MFKVNNFTPFSGVFVVVFEYVNVSWVHFRRVLKRKFNKVIAKIIVSSLHLPCRYIYNLKMFSFH